VLTTNINTKVRFPYYSRPEIKIDTTNHHEGQDRDLHQEGIKTAEIIEVQDKEVAIEVIGADVKVDQDHHIRNEVVTKTIIKGVIRERLRIIMTRRKRRPIKQSKNAS